MRHIITLTTALFLAACNQRTPNPILGIWTGNRGSNLIVVAFFEDSISYQARESEPVTYQVLNSSVIVTRTNGLSSTVSVVDQDHLLLTSDDGTTSWQMKRTTLEQANAMIEEQLDRNNHKE